LQRSFSYEKKESDLDLGLAQEMFGPLAADLSESLVCTFDYEPTGKLPELGQDKGLASK
jgi:hypothetical protein